MNAGAALRLKPKVQRGDIREADQGLGWARRPGAEPAQKPRRAVAAARTEHGADAGVGERRAELCQTPRIVPGEVAAALKKAILVLGPVARADQAQSRVKSRALESTGRRDYRHAVARAQR